MLYGLVLRLVIRLSLIAVITVGLYFMQVAAFGTFQPWLLLFYTNLSNLAVLFIIALFCIEDISQLLTKKSPFTEKQKHNLHQLKIALTWAISITGIVWHLVLVPAIEHHIQNPAIVTQFLPYFAHMRIDYLLYSMAILHTWSPLLAFVDWLVFEKKGSIRPITPIKWLLIPAGYFLFICLWVNLIGPVNSEYNFTYPYGFIDFTENPVWVVLRNVALTGIGALVLGYLYFALDKFLAKISIKTMRLIPGRYH